MNEDTKIILILTGIVLLFIGTAVCSVYLFGKNIYCPRYANSVDLEYRYSFLAGGCFVNYQGQWILADNLRAGKLD